MGDRAGWYTFSPEGRFLTNYVGLRGRAAVLAEAYSYLPFGRRVRATQQFVSAVLDEAARRAGDLQTLSRRADRQRVTRATLPVRADFGPGERHSVLMGAVTEEPHPVTGEPMRQRVDDVVEPTPMPAFISFEGTLGVKAPAAYLVPADQQAVIERLRLHGVPIETGAVDVSAARTLRLVRVEAGEPYQKRRPLTIETGDEIAFEADSAVLIPTDGPLGRLAVLLLDPRSSDGFAAWGVVEGVAAGRAYPIGWLP